jgi:hypothetical protein
MESASHPDLIHEAAGHSAQRAAQLTSLAVASAQVYVMYRARRAALRAAADEQEARALREQERQAVQRARAGWAPALDQRWLAQADLLQATRAWGAAAPYAGADATAAAALRLAEERLRVLHPYAMARYDRLRRDGMSPADAMVEAAPLFARPPRAYERPPAPDRAGIEVAPTGSDPGIGTGRTANDERLAAQAEQPRAADLVPAITTTEQAGRSPAEAGSQTAGEAVFTALAADRASPTAAALAARGFPYTIRQALRSAGTAVTAPPRSGAAAEHAPRHGLAR